MLSVLSAATHLLMPFVHGGGVLAWVMVPLALVCLVCAVHLWNKPTRETWKLSALMYGWMLGIHAFEVWLNSVGNSGSRPLAEEGHAMHGGSEMPLGAALPVDHETLMSAGTVFALTALGTAILQLCKPQQHHSNPEMRFPL